MEQPRQLPPDPAAQLLADSYPLIRRLLRQTARRHRLSEDERDEFEGWVWLRLVERDFHILRTFGGRSSLATYLGVVFCRCLIDFRSARWGKWRPSAAARRLGPQAVRLEQLVTRDGLPVPAAEARTGLSAAVLPALGQRARPRIVETLDLAAETAAPSTTGPEEPLLAVERQAAADDVRRALAQALATLGENDRRLLWLRHGAALTVPAIAARIGVNQKRLYRTFDRLHAALRARLERRGVTAGQIAGLIGTADVWWNGAVASRPAGASLLPRHPRSRRVAA